MAITAQSIIRRATDLLQDQTSVRWTLQELVRWLNDAQRAIVKVRPDAMNTTVTMSLSAGSRQDLDSTTANEAGNAALAPAPAKLIDITRNMASTSTKDVVTKVEKKIMDAIRGWHSVTPSVNILHYIFDAKDPKTFYVYPPATSLAKLEVMYSAYPTDIAAPAAGAVLPSDNQYDNTSNDTGKVVLGNLSVPDIYADDVLNILLAKCYMKDSEFAGNAERASAYLSMAQKSLGDEIAATIAVQPK
jgi:hypothetical protein